MREGIIARPLIADVETGDHRYGARLHQVLLETGKERVERALATDQQAMGVPALRNARTMPWLRGQGIALEHDHPLEAPGERPGGREPADPCADHDGLPADHAGAIPSLHRM